MRYHDRLRLFAFAALGMILLFLAAPGVRLQSAEPPLVAPTAEDLEFFERQVRPVLANHCWECHGEKKQEAGLRLDSAAAILRGGDSGAVVKPKRPDESPLIAAIRRTGEPKMPPDRPLPEPAIRALTQWVERGLPWPADSSPRPAGDLSAELLAAAAKHWAFQAVRPPALPYAAPQPNDAWSRVPLDRFVAVRRDAAGLTPALAADPATVARRITFDLTGLPPTPDELASFVTDDSPDAYERLVDRLLASPRYGERWARVWLDIARYADNKGYVFFEEKTYPWAYAYRDYVVESFNGDLPYDRFVTEQLAADQLDLGPDRRPLRALAFLTIGAHFMNNTHDILDDRIDVITRGLLGVTAVCARCHDHKYDPVPQADYYSLYGILRSCEEPTVPPLFDTPVDTEDYRKFTAELNVRVGKLDEFVTRKHRDLVQGARTRVAEYLLAADQARRQPATDDFMLIADTNDLNPTMIVRWRVYLEKTARQPHPVWSVWNRLVALDDAQFAAGAAALAQELTAHPNAAVNSRVRQRFAAQPPANREQAAQAYAELLANVEKQWQERLADASQKGQAAPLSLADPADEELRRALYGPDAPPDVPLLLGWGFLSLLPDRASQGEFQKLLKEVESWIMTAPGAPPRAMVVVDSPHPHEPRIFLRGNPNRLGEPVPRQFLAIATPHRKPYTQGSGRLELAREIVAPTNPLTARVFVNRIWGQLIGTPLVRTPSDFGLRSEPPTHPELLDHLAIRFVEDGWSVKRLQRAIVTSATYRQSSRSEGDAGAKDPENRWLARMNSRRLAFESLRDSLLAAADRLDYRLGGPAVQLLGDGIVPRRTLYGFIDRMDVPSLLTTFDFPNPSVSSPQRESTTVAPQALFLMNGPFVAEIAAQVAQRPDLTSAASAAERVNQLCRILYGRLPSDSERAAMLNYLGEQPNEERWRRLAHALLMTNEFLFVD